MSILDPSVRGATLFLALLAPPALHAQRMQLSAPLEQVVAGKVLDQRVSADGSFLVYSADPLANGRHRLVRADPSGATALIDLGVEIFQPHFEIDPTGARVVYRGRTVANLPELISVPSDGSGPAVRLLPDLPPPQFVGQFTITPDGTQVLYVAEQHQPGQSELYAVPIQGGPSVKISAPLPAGSDVLNFELARDGSTVVYRAMVGPGGIDLFVGNLSGRQPARRLGPAHGQGRGVERFAISSQDEVLYLSDIRLNARNELFAVPLAGGLPRRLNQPVRAGGVEEFVLTPDGKRVVYNAHVSDLHLFTVPVQGGVEPVQLGPDLSGSVNRFFLDPTGRRVVFILRRSPPEPSQMLVAPVDGSQPAVRLDLDEVPEQAPSDFRLTPDGTRVVYDEGPTTARRVYVSPLDAGAPPLLLATMPYHALTGIDARSRYAVYGLTSIRLDGGREPFSLGGATPPVVGQVEGDLVLYQARVPGDGFHRTDLYGVPVDGSAEPVQISAPFPPGPVVDDVTGFVPAAAASRAAYTTRSGQLFGVALDGSESAVPISDPQAGPFSGLVVSPDGSWIAYTQGGFLLLAGLDGSVPAVQVAAAALPVQVTPDGAHLLYFVPEGAAHALESLPLDGSGPAVRFEGTFAAGSPRLVTPDSARVLYFGEVDGLAGLLVAPTDASSTPHVVPDVMLQSGQVLHASPDGRHVVYRGLTPDLMGERLYSLDLHGVLTPVVLDDLPFAGYSPPRIDPTSRHVVYLAREAGLLSLRRVAIEGGGPSVPILDPYAGLPVDVLAFSSDGEHVLLPYDAQTLRHEGEFGEIRIFDYDVLAVPFDGSQATVQLNVERAGPGSMEYLTLRVPLYVGPAGRVLFPEGTQSPEGARLISTSLEGGPRAVLTPGGLGGGREVHITPDGRLAVFEMPLPGGSGLYEAATDGSQPLRLLSGPHPVGNSIGPPSFFGYPPRFTLTPDGAFAAYIGDLDENEQYELFASPLSSAPRRSGGPGETRRR